MTPKEFKSQYCFGTDCKELVKVKNKPKFTNRQIWTNTDYVGFINLECTDKPNSYIMPKELFIDNVRYVRAPSTKGA